MFVVPLRGGANESRVGIVAVALSAYGLFAVRNTNVCCI